MTNFCLNPEWLKHRRWNWGVIALMVIFLGIAFTPTDCRAQAVPTRNQSEIMTRPIVQPPEPPLQKEIRQLRREVRERPPQIINKYYSVHVPAQPDNIRFLENRIKKMEYEIAVQEAELSRLRQELRHRQGR